MDKDMDFCLLLKTWAHMQLEKCKGFSKIAKNLNNKYGQKLLDSGKKSATGVIKAAPKRTIQKTAEVTGDLIGNKIADKITSVSTSPKELHSNKLHLKTDENETDISREIYISPEKRQQIIDELRLV